MSLKSFDKFCETLITGENASQKEIYDERQKQQRTQLTVEALSVHSVLTLILIAANETVRFSESNFMLVVMSMAVAYLWCIIRNAAKGTLFGVPGKSTLYSAIFMLFYIPLLVLNFPENAQDAVILKDNVLTEWFISYIAIGMVLISEIITLVAYKKSKKNNTEQD